MTEFFLWFLHLFGSAKSWKKSPRKKCKKPIEYWYIIKFISYYHHIIATYSSKIGIFPIPPGVHFGFLLENPKMQAQKGCYLHPFTINTMDLTWWLRGTHMKKDAHPIQGNSSTASWSLTFSHHEIFSITYSFWQKKKVLDTPIWILPRTSVFLGQMWCAWWS